MTNWWQEVRGAELGQGDLIANCLMPQFSGFGSEVEVHEETIRRARLIVLTQSCDIDNDKTEFIALCPVYTIQQYELSQPVLRIKGRWEQIRRGRQPGLHLLASFDNPEDNRSALVVDFKQIVSLPLTYLKLHAATFATRYRLNSPYLEHFSQALARFFMRVGLPSDIPPYK